MKYRRIFLLIALALLLVPFVKAKAAEVSNQTDSCTDVLLVFARGSGDNNNAKYLNQPFSKQFGDVEKVAGAFFQNFQTLIEGNYPHVTYKAHSVHDFVGKYNYRGYPAPSVFGKQFIANNGANAEASWWPVGDYQNSIKDGKEEVVGFVRDEINKCPDQKVVMGGYSQGAQVMGEAVWNFTPEEREQIKSVVLFGDPKYIGAKTSWKPWEDPQPYPWKRGTASIKKHGIAEAREPYVPDDIKFRTQSWCYDDDPICTNTGTFVKNFVNELVNLDFSLSGLSVGHSRYASHAVTPAVNEIIQYLSPELYALEKSHKGVDKSAGPTQPISFKPSSKPIETMILVNVSAGMDDVIGTLRHDTDNVMPNMNIFFPGSRYGVADISEQSEGSVLYPRYNFLQDLRPYYPPADSISSSSLYSVYLRKLAFGGWWSGGGVDRADPLGLAIEKTAMMSDWTSEATKHIILITNRPFKDPQVYNICNSTTYDNIGLPAGFNCLSQPKVAYSAKAHPELCNNINEIIFDNVCKLDLPQPTPVHNISRTLNDQINLAQSQKVAVSIVVPHQISMAVDPYDKTDVPAQLRYFAEATGGLYIKYDTFNRANYSDMLWQVLNHEPKRIELAYKDALDHLEASQALNSKSSVQAKTNVPIIFDVSASSLTANNYKWDFDGDNRWDQYTQSPNTEYTYTEPTKDRFMQVEAYNGDELQARLSLPLVVEMHHSLPLNQTSIPGPVNIVATKTDDKNIKVSWQDSESNAVVVIKDPVSGLPIVSLPESYQGITIPADMYSGTTLLVLTVAEKGESEPLIINIEYTPLVVKPNYNGQTLGFSDKYPSKFKETVAGNELLFTDITQIQITDTEVIQAISSSAANFDTAVLDNVRLAEPSNTSVANSNKQVLSAEDKAYESKPINFSNHVEPFWKNQKIKPNKWGIIMAIILTVIALIFINKLHNKLKSSR